MPIKYIKGDATQPQAKGVKCIPHICNDLGKWGKGFVLAVSERWPDARVRYLEWYNNHKKNKEQAEEIPFSLGSVQLLQVERYIYVANMIAQKGIHQGSGGPPIRYDALEKCLEFLAATAKPDWSFHLPRIGTGLAGGKWDKIEPIIEKALGKFSVTVYDFE